MPKNAPQCSLRFLKRVCNRAIQRLSIRLDPVPEGSQNQRSARSILLAATALAALTSCQGTAEKQRPEAAAQSGDLANCARIRVVPGGCGGNSRLTEVYVDNMHKDHTVRATVRKHSSQEGDDDTDYAIAGGGQLFIGCGGGNTSFAVVGCEVLKGEAEKVDQR
jgi:hypothetical protein